MGFKLYLIKNWDYNCLATTTKLIFLHFSIANTDIIKTANLTGQLYFFIVQAFFLHSFAIVQVRLPLYQSSVCIRLVYHFAKDQSVSGFRMGYHFAKVQFVSGWFTTLPKISLYQDGFPLCQSSVCFRLGYNYGKFLSVSGWVTTFPKFCWYQDDLAKVSVKDQSVNSMCRISRASSPTQW